ncbi:MAG: hypothetical protein ABSH00_12915 [Bryobacteraceae bacterium]|jgi:hypothetical protein
MGVLGIPQIEWIREYLEPFFPCQSFPERASLPDTIIVDVTDSQRRPKELRVSRDFLRRYSKQSVQEYLKKAGIAAQLEAVPVSVAIKEM